MQQVNETLDFRSTGKPKILRSLYKLDGWKRYSFDVFNGGEVAAGRLDINIAQHPKHVTSWQLFLFDSSDRSRAKVFESPIPFPFENKEELFEKAKRKACYYYENTNNDNRQSIPLEQTAFYK